MDSASAAGSSSSPVFPSNSKASPPGGSSTPNRSSDERSSSAPRSLASGISQPSSTVSLDRGVSPDPGDPTATKVGDLAAQVIARETPQQRAEREKGMHLAFLVNSLTNHIQEDDMDGLGALLSQSVAGLNASDLIKVFTEVANTSGIPFPQPEHLKRIADALNISQTGASSIKSQEEKALSLLKAIYINHSQMPLVEFFKMQGFNPLTQSPTQEQYGQLIGMAPYLTYVNCDGLPPFLDPFQKAIQTFLSCCDNAEVLHISSPHVTKLPYSPFLKEIICTGCAITKITQNLPDCILLDCSSCDQLNNLSVNAPKLRALHVRNCSNLREVDLTKLTGLGHLSAEGCCAEIKLSDGFKGESLSYSASRINDDFYDLLSPHFKEIHLIDDNKESS